MAALAANPDRKFVYAEMVCSCEVCILLDVLCKCWRTLKELQNGYVVILCLQMAQHLFAISEP